MSFSPEDVIADEQEMGSQASGVKVARDFRDQPRGWTRGGSWNEARSL